MYNSFDFKKFEQRLLEALNKNESFIRVLEEQETAADQAKKMGLTSMGFGRWGKDKKVTHKTTNGKLEPVKQDDEKDKEIDVKQGAAKDKKDDKKNAAPKQDDAKGKKDSKDFTKQHKDPERQRAQQVLPNARLTSRPLSRVPREDLAPVATRIDDLARMGQEAKERGEKAPDYNLCQVSIPGTNLFCGEHKGIERDDMPQFKGEAEPGSPADKLPRDPKNGEVDAEEMFKQMLDRDGIAVSEPQEVSPDQLRATQSELKGVQVAGMMKALEENPQHPAITAPIYVSRDGYVLDGHHRWAAIVAYNASHPDSPIPMQVRVIDEDITPLVKRANQYAREIGIKPKSAKSKDAKKPAEKEPEQSKEEPKKKGFLRRTLDAVKNWPKKFKEEAKQFFESEGHTGGSKERRSLVQKARDKATGAVKAVRHGFKHEMATFRDAGRGLRGFFRGKGPNKREREAMVAVGIKLVTTALFATALGGAAHGITAFAKHVLIDFIPHVVGETIAKGAGQALVAAGPEDETDDKMMEKYLELLLKNFEEMDIPDEIIEKAIQSFNTEQETEK